MVGFFDNLCLAPAVKHEGISRTVVEFSFINFFIRPFVSYGMVEFISITKVCIIQMDNLFNKYRYLRSKVIRERRVQLEFRSWIASMQFGPWQPSKYSLSSTAALRPKTILDIVSLIKDLPCD